MEDEAPSTLHAPAPKSVDAALEEVEAEIESLRDAVERAGEEASESHRVGATVLDALESAMAPLMARLAVARSHCQGLDMDGFTIGIDHRGLAEPGQRESPLEAEAEIQHLEQDIDHFQTQVERLQVEETQRGHELRRLKTEIAEAQENLAYEQQRVKHLELVQQAEAHGVIGWTGIGPTGIGRRTLQVRAEKKLRECAEQRGCRLIRNVSELAGDTAAQQSAIAMLTKKLTGVRAQAQQKARELAKTTLHAEDLRLRLSGKVPEDAASRGGVGMMTKKKATKSTGKLPQLSF